MASTGPKPLTVLSGGSTERHGTPGRGGGQGRYRGRGGQRGRGHQGPNTNNNVIKFVGACDGLKGFVYDCADDTTGGKPVDMYICTTEATSIFMGSTWKGGMDIKSAIDNDTVPTFMEPEALTDKSTSGKKSKYDAKIKEVVKRETLLEENMGQLFLSYSDNVLRA